MAQPNITISLATEDDASELASVMTAAFSHIDRAYPLIWGSAPEGTHNMIVIQGLFSPVQKEGRVTLKAVDGERIVGFATWGLPKKPAVEKEAEVKEEKGSGLPVLPGVNMALWEEIIRMSQKYHDRDVQPEKDTLLSFFFVHPEYQRKGIGSLLLGWGIKKADELDAKLWLTSTPQAVSTYARNGWKVVERHEIDLGKYGGEGIYSRAWMLREPKRSV